MKEVFDSVEVKRAVSFGSAVNNRGQSQELKLDLYLPEGDTEKKRPAIVWAHGGGFKGGKRNQKRHHEIMVRFARLGYVAASIDYRLRPIGTPGSTESREILLKAKQGKEADDVRDARHDMQAAIRWMRMNANTYDVDPNLIIAGGSSAGAITALQAAFNSDDPGASGNPGQRSDVAAVVSLWGTSTVSWCRSCSTRSVESQIEAGDPPIVMFHGTEDETVPFASAEATCQATVALGNACEFHGFPGEGHGLWEHIAQIIQDSSRFLCGRLLGGCSEG